MKRHDGNGATYACYLVSAILLVGNMYLMHSVQPPVTTDLEYVPTYEIQRITIPAISDKMERRPNADFTRLNEEKIPLTSEHSRKYYDVPLSHDVQDVVFSECEANNVPADLVIALMGVESNYDPKCISKTKDYGLMQINVCHQKSLKKDLNISNLLDAKQNVKAGVHMLSGIVNKYSDTNQVLMVYNCGEIGAQKLWKRGIYSTAYSRKIVSKIHEIKG